MLGYFFSISSLDNMTDPSCQCRLFQDDSNELISDGFDEEVICIGAQIFPSDGEKVYRTRNSCTSLFQRTTGAKHIKGHVETR